MYQVYIFIKQLLTLYLQSMWKWILRRVTGRCELLRIQYDEQPGALRTFKTEMSLVKSKFAECRSVTDRSPDETSLSDKIQLIMAVKHIFQEKHPIFRLRFTECVERINGYAQLIEELELLRNQKYEEGKHEKQLLGLWKTLKPDEPLEQRYTRQWGDIGFQGMDPATDFRGMGLLGFQNLIYLSQQHTDIARRTLVHSNHPKYGYSFAIVGINITSLCVKCVKNGSLKAHFYNLDTHNPSIADFHELYCYMFVEFDKLWMTEKPNIMQFNEMRDKYEKRLLQQLSNPSTRLSLSPDTFNLVAQEC